MKIEETKELKATGVLLIKQYVIDMDKVKECKDTNEKLDALFTILSEIQMNIAEYALTDKLRPFVKEII